MEARTVQVRVRHWGKAPKKYGVNAYKFSAKLRAVLERNGWTFLGKTPKYDYFSHPRAQTGNHIIVTASTPSDAEIERVALNLHTAGKHSIEELGDWIVIYHPSSSLVIHSKIFFTGEQIEPLQTGTSHAWFQVGSHCTWNVSLNWRDGNDNAPQWHKSEDSIISDLPSNVQNELFFDGLEQDDPARNAKAQNSSSEILREGKVQQALVNVYERNPEARRRCIEHYGANCRACGFSFAQRYGNLGEGFIHVHHSKPLSSIKGEYEVDPIRDLIPVCANCHAMLHLRNPPYTIDELKAIMNK